MMKRDWLWVALIVSVLLNVFLATIVNRQRTTDMPADTPVVHDTIRIVEPAPTGEDVMRYDTAAFPMVGQSELKSEPKGGLKNIPISNELDSTSNLTSNLTQDSAKVVIPITERTYEDSAYKAVVRGYNPELVSLDIYQSTITKTITKTKNPKITVSAGIYGGFGSKGADYGLGVMVGVPIWSW